MRGTYRLECKERNRTREEINNEWYVYREKEGEREREGQRAQGGAIEGKG